MNILVIGANGMLGNACMNYFNSRQNFDAYGTVRLEESKLLFPPRIREKIISGINITRENIWADLFQLVKPDVVINCVGIVKQSQEANNLQKSILLNSLLPHQLANECRQFNAKLIQISTDCVYSGLKGSSYQEIDPSDALDIYGRTKYLGEISDDPNVLTLRTSYIGNELMGSNGLLEWFLSQEGECKGFTRAIYSGMPTITLMKVLGDILVRHPSLSGLYQVASEPISKYNLLRLIAKIFQKEIKINPVDSLVIDRSLDGSRFKAKTGFVAPPWEEMVENMYLDRVKNVQK